MIIIIILVRLVNNSVKFKDIYDPGLCKYFFVDILISTLCFTEIYVDKICCCCYRGQGARGGQWPAVEDGEEQFARARGRTNIYSAATLLPAMLSTM